VGGGLAFPRVKTHGLFIFYPFRVIAPVLGQGKFPSSGESGAKTEFRRNERIIAQGVSLGK